MEGVYQLVTIGLFIVVFITQLLLLFRKVSVDLEPLQQTLKSVENSYERMERFVRDEFTKNREESNSISRQSREELSSSLKIVGDDLHQQFSNLTETSQRKSEELRHTVEQQLRYLQSENTTKLDQVRHDILQGSKDLREEIAATLKTFNDSLVKNLGEIGNLQKSQLDVFSERLDKLTQTNEIKLASMRDIIEQKLTSVQDDNNKKLEQIRQESTASAQKAREEVSESLKSFNDSVLKGMTNMSDSQQKQMELFSGQLGKLTESNQQQFDVLKNTVELKLKAIQDDNTKQLDQMRATVDEKLQGTLEKRLGESFKLVSERLEQVYKGLGEMQTLATGVGDLKKVLTNVKTRGTWGEVQLGAMLEQVLTTEQFEKNVATKNTGERVEYGIKLPGKAEDRDDIVWLPIDAKFPVEDYQRLMDAQEKADITLADIAIKELENRIKQCASDISNKYINPPKTTDFAILYLPTEGLFAEVIRRTNLIEQVQREYRVVIAGPTTLWSILNSLQLGFRTLAIQKRSSEVWNLLAAVKTEWTKYGEVLDKVQKKIQEASNTIESAQTRTRAIGRKLRNVQELPANQAESVLRLDKESQIFDSESDE
jgi:DNA recombination protein RmuC